MSLSTAFPSATPALNLNFVRNNRLDPRLTYSRASTGTYVGSDGYIKTAAINEPRFEYDPVTLAPRGLLHEGPRTNLTLYSQDMDNAYWNKPSSIVSANVAIAPDGTMTADKLIPTATTATGISSNITVGLNKTYTQSIYVKAGENSVFQMQMPTVNFGSGSDRLVEFDLITLTMTGTGGTMTHVGNGWYRCTITATASTGSGSSSIQHYVRDNTTANGTDGLYIWGAQFEEAFFASSYIPTTSATVTRAADEMSIVDRPIIEDRTNFLTYSEQFDNFTKQYATVSTNSIIAPNGTLTADKIIEDATTSNKEVLQSGLTVTAGIPYTVSVYAKAAERTAFRIGLLTSYFSGAITNAVFQLSTGTTAGISGGYTSQTITNVGNGWYRCTATFVTTVTGSGLNLYFTLTNGTAPGYAGDGTSGIYLWGAQLEAGTSATEYIPTGASAVTIPAPTRTISDNKFSSWYNQANGAFVISSDTFKAENTANTTYSRIFNLSDGTTDGRYTLFYNTTGGVSMSATGAGFVASDSDSGVASKTVQKVGVNIQAGNSFLTHNGIQAGTTDTAAIVMNYMNNFTFFEYGTSSDEVNYGWGHMQYLLYYAEPLTLAQLRTLTK